MHVNERIYKLTELFRPNPKAPVERYIRAVFHQMQQGPVELLFKRMYVNGNLCGNQEDCLKGLYYAAEAEYLFEQNGKITLTDAGYEKAAEFGYRIKRVIAEAA